MLPSFDPYWALSDTEYLLVASRDSIWSIRWFLRSHDGPHEADNHSDHPDYT